MIVTEPKEKPVWEKIFPGEGEIYRTRTPTGWLVREVTDVVHISADRGIFHGYDWRTSLVFVPDPDGVWLAEKS